MKKLLFTLALIITTCLTASADAQYSMTGKIGGKYGIVFNFYYQSNGRISGSYYYTSKGAGNQIELRGYRSGKTWRIEEYVNGYYNGVFVLIPSYKAKHRRYLPVTASGTYSCADGRSFGVRLSGTAEDYDY